MKKTTNIISIVLILLYIAFMMIGWKSFPEKVPTHFGMNGVADSYGGRSSLLIEPAVMLGLFLLLAIVENFPRLWNIPVEVTEDNAAEIERICHGLFGIIKVTEVVLCAITGLMCIYPGFPVWPMWTLVAVIVVTIAVSIYRIFRCS